MTKINLIKTFVFASTALPFTTGFAMDWLFRSGGMFAAEGGLLTGSKIPINSTSQKEYDDESAKSGLSKAAIEKIKTSKLYGLEGFATGTAVLGYEGYSNNLEWQSSLDLKASAGAGNSSGQFFSPAFDPVFPLQGRGGRNSGWLAGGEWNLNWLPLNSLSLHTKAGFFNGADLFKQSFSRFLIEPDLEFKTGGITINPGFSWQRILSLDALPAADVSAWSIDLEWVINRTIRLQNPKGYPLMKVWRSSALGSPLLVTALENEGRFFEINLTPRINLSGGLSFASHFRSVSGSEQSYIAPSLATELNRRGRQQNDWRPPAASADFSSQKIEWRNSLNQKIATNWNIYGTVLYTNQSSSFTQSPNSNLRYSDLIDSARESSFRYFFGSEFLL
ncbi:MAG: hypothetical protein ACO3A4_02075 [Silvanigrellaceae bacterium]